MNSFLIKYLVLLAIGIFLPFIIVFIFILLDFFIYGSGASASILYERDRYIWIAVYSIVMVIYLVYSAGLLRSAPSKYMKFLFYLLVLCSAIYVLLTSF